jgi:hypothetical protein
MNEKMKAALGSYLRAFAVAAGTYVANADGGITLEGLVIAGLIAVAGPALRAVNPKDPSFGLIANVVDSELKKLSEKAATKKKAPAKKKSSGGGKPSQMA